MVEIKIPARKLDKWQDFLDSLQRVTGLGVVFSLFENDDPYSPVVRSSQEFSFNTHALTIQSVVTKVASGAYREAVCGQLDQIHYAGVPVYWEGHSLYGALIIMDGEQQIISDHLHLVEATASHIEKDLKKLYQQQYHTDLGKAPVLDSALFQNFIDSFSDYIWIKDEQGIYTHCSVNTEKAWNKSRAEIVGSSDYDLFSPEIAQKYEAADKKVLANGKQMVVEERVDVKSASRNKWLETIKAPLKDCKGETVGVIGITRNISNRKVIEEQLMLAGTVFENSVEGVIITDSSGNIVYVNRSFCEITGYDEMEVIGRNPRLLKSGRHDHDFYKKMWTSLIEKGKWQGEIWNRRKDGAIYPELATFSVVYNENGKACNYVAVFTDISMQKQHEQKLSHMAYHDPLTSLPNRSKLIAQIESEINRVKRHGSKFATVFIDVDHFKHINDTYGHLVGDEVLCEMARRLRLAVREEDMVSRIGGDEFVLLMPSLKREDAMARVVQKLMATFDKPVVLSNGEQLRLTGSMGIALYPGDGDDSATLLKNADTAMYRAKQNRNDFAYYTEELTHLSEVHLKLQGAMYEALENDSFHLVYQPQVDIRTGMLVGFETLIRWEHPEVGLIPPLKFIPIAESSGLIHDIGFWVLKHACAQAVEWLNQGYQFGRMAVNVSGLQLQRSSFVNQVKKVLEQSGLEAKYLELEVTENFMLNKTEQAIANLKGLRDLGVELAMDDFGTGYSSLSYLQKLPLHKIKIDGSFIKNIPEDNGDIAITDAVIALGRALNLKVIAEGVETKAQLDFLEKRGCGQVQGFYTCKPQRAEDLIDILDKTCYPQQSIIK